LFPKDSGSSGIQVQNILIKFLRFDSRRNCSLPRQWVG